jgi:putative two-component system response regulator
LQSLTEATLDASPAKDNRPTILIVDDTADNLIVMSELLGDAYRVKVANSGERALRIAAGDPQPDLILLDIMMPAMDGHEVCRRLKEDATTRHIPVIFLTARSAMEDERKGLDLGALDYVTKPISPPVVLARVRNHLQLKQLSDIMREQNVYLEAEVQRRTQELRAIQDTMILAMTSLAETRDNETGNHIRRTQNYVRTLADELRHHPKFADFLTSETIELLCKSAPLHDLGKIGIPDAILLKPGKLTPAEFEVMKRHTTIGRDAILIAQRRVADARGASFLHFAGEIAYSHHEKWNGGGYPEGLAGDAIPVAARLMAIADVYDALICRRVYKEPFRHDQAVALILDGRGSHFDPDVTDCFAQLAPRFNEVAIEFADEGAAATSR